MKTPRFWIKYLTECVFAKAEQSEQKKTGVNLAAAGTHSAYRSYILSPHL